MPNLQGTDFFVGDIHGAFHLLAEALENVGFNPAVDRLIAVGDLIDRGEHNDMALEWLRQPFFHTVRGNHEELFLEWYELRHDRDSRKLFEKERYFPNGGSWVEGLDPTQQQRFAEQFEQLPYFLSVGAPDGRTVGVVHAELPDGVAWPQLICQPPNEDLLHSMTWGRHRLRHARRKARGLESSTRDPLDCNHIRGLALLICGHFTVSKPKLLGNILYLDTGGWNGNGHGQFTVMRLNDALQKISAP